MSPTTLTWGYRGVPSAPAAPDAFGKESIGRELSLIKEYSYCMQIWD